MLEINRNSEYTYRINPDDPKQIDRRLNQHGARWCFFLRRASKNEANAALFNLNRGGSTEGTNDADG